MKSIFSKHDPKKTSQPRQLRELTPDEVRVIAGGPIGTNENGNHV
jgi:hypothetical protein